METMTFSQVLDNPLIPNNESIEEATGNKNQKIDFWEELIGYVIKDASVRRYRLTKMGSIILRHHSFGDQEFELFKDGSIRGTANFLRIVHFFGMANVVFEAPQL